MTEEPSRCAAIFPYCLEYVTEIGITIAAPHRSAHGEENDVGSLHPLRKETRKPYAVPVARLRATSSSNPGSYIGNDVVVQLCNPIPVFVDTSDAPPKLSKTGADTIPHSRHQSMQILNGSLHPTHS